MVDKKDIKNGASKVKAEKDTSDKKHKKIKNYHYGHRERLRKRFLKAPEGAFVDYEILEMILFAAHTRGDVKPLSRTLLKKYKHFNKLINADSGDLKEVEGVTDSVVATLRAIKEICTRALKDEIEEEADILNSSDKLYNYCKIKISQSPSEHFRIFYLDKKLKLISDALVCEGGVDYIPIVPSKIVKEALDLGAAGVILFHNHPSGDPTPSKSDIEATHQLKDSLGGVGVKMWEHLIIGKNKYYSFKKNGLLLNKK